jgi:RNA polymerase sigma-70 factor (ECF subfamily)
LAVSDSSAHSAQRYELVDPDVRLMLQVRDGSAVAFEELMLRYQSRLITVLEHLVHKRGQAEDLAQEVFLRVYKARKSYVPNAKFSTWLFTIANNVASNSLRGLSRRKEVNLAPKNGESGPHGLDQLALAQSGQMPARRLDKSETADIVRLALESLNERQKMAVVLSKFEGMSYIDIADTMGLSVQAVKSLLSRARVNLKAILEPYMATGDKPLGGGAVPDEDEDLE